MTSRQDGNWSLTGDKGAGTREGEALEAKPPPSAAEGDRGTDRRVPDGLCHHSPALSDPEPTHTPALPPKGLPRASQRDFRTL